MEVFKLDLRSIPGGTTPLPCRYRCTSGRAKNSGATKLLARAEPCLLLGRQCYDELTSDYTKQFHVMDETNNNKRSFRAGYCTVHAHLVARPTTVEPATSCYVTFTVQQLCGGAYGAWTSSCVCSMPAPSKVGNLRSPTSQLRVALSLK